MKNKNLIEIKTINDFVNKVTRENLNEVVENAILHLDALQNDLSYV